MAGTGVKIVETSDGSFIAKPLTEEVKAEFEKLQRAIWALGYRPPYQKGAFVDGAIGTGTVEGLLYALQRVAAHPQSSTRQCGHGRTCLDRASEAIASITSRQGYDRVYWIVEETRFLTTTLIEFQKPRRAWLWALGAGAILLVIAGSTWHYRKRLGRGR